MKKCEDCRWITETGWVYACRAPQLGVDVISGRQIIEPINKRTRGTCGIEAKFFEPRPEPLVTQSKPIRFWQRIKTRLTKEQ